MAISKRKMAEHVQRTRNRVERLFRELFPDRELVSVRVEPGTAWEDEEDILNVFVEFEGADRLDVEKSLELRMRGRRYSDNEEDESRPPFALFYFRPLAYTQEKSLAV